MGYGHGGFRGHPFLVDKALHIIYPMPNVLFPDSLIPNLLTSAK
jgi:hypothetical protein